MPLFCIWRQNFLSRYAVTARFTAVEQRLRHGENRKPLAVLSLIVCAAVSTTESSRPPVVMYDRRRAVALAVHLVQSARLEARGHQEDVGARLDLMRHAFVVADMNAPTSRLGYARQLLETPPATPRRPNPGSPVARAVRAVRPRISSTRSKPF